MSRWHKREVISLCGLLVALLTLVINLTAPELRCWLFKDCARQIVTENNQETNNTPQSQKQKWEEEQQEIEPEPEIIPPQPQNTELRKVQEVAVEIPVEPPQIQKQEWEEEQQKIEPETEIALSTNKEELERNDLSDDVETKSTKNCHASYLGVCIPPPPPDLDCGDVRERNFKVVPPDPHKFDRDMDGLGCEIE